MWSPSTWLRDAWAGSALRDLGDAGAVWCSCVPVTPDGDAAPATGSPSDCVYVSVCVFGLDWLGLSLIRVCVSVWGPPACLPVRTASAESPSSRCDSLV